MKKILSLACSALLCAMLAVLLAGCVGQPAPSGSSGTASTSASVAASSSAASTSTSSSSGSGSSASGGSYAESHLSGGTYNPPDITVEKKGEYTDKDHVALFIHEYGTVPSNYVTKTKARNAGWVNTKGNLWDVLPGKSIGGGGFYNDDGMLPDAPGREWFECDIDYEGGFRNAKRIVYSNDGLVYYTDDHYETFQRLY